MIQPLSDLTWTIAVLDFHIIHHTLMFVLQKGKLQVRKSIVYETVNCKEITICQVVVATALFQQNPCKSFCPHKLCGQKDL